MRHAKISLAVVVLFSFAVSVLSPLMAGTQTVTLPDPPVNVTMCRMYDTSTHNSIYPRIYNTAYFVGFVGIVLVLIFAYVRIWMTIRRHNVYMRRNVGTPPLNLETERPDNKDTDQATCGTESDSVQCLTLKPLTDVQSLQCEKTALKSATSCERESDSTETDTRSVDLPETNDDEIVSNAVVDHKTATVVTAPLAATNSGAAGARGTRDGPTNADAADLAAATTGIAAPSSGIAAPLSGIAAPSSSTVGTSTASFKRRSRFAIQIYRTTIIAFLVTAVFFLSFVPFFVFSTIARAGVKHMFRGAELATFQFFYSFPYLNAVANPIIYGVLNPAFRAQCARMLKKMCCRKTASLQTQSA